MAPIYSYKTALDFNISTSEEIEHICSPIFKLFSLTYFAFLKIMNDGSILRLSNHKAWTTNYFNKKLFNETNFYTNHWQQVKLGGSKKFLWRYQRQSKMHNEWNCHGIGNGFSIYRRKHDNTLETYSFGTDLENYSANAQYIKYNDDFDDFITYFHKNAMHLINIEDKSICITPLRNLILEKDHNEGTGLSQKNIDRFLKSINLL